MTRFNRLLRVTLSSAIFVAALAMSAPQSSAQPTLYFTTDGSGSDPGTPVELPLGGSELIRLWFNPGPTPSDPGPVFCNGGAGGTGGNGDDSCAIHFKILVDGDLSISSFNPLVGIAEVNSTTTDINASILTTDPGAFLPADTATEVATFMLDTSGTQGGIGTVTFLQSVDADLDLVVGIEDRGLFCVPECVPVPEPAVVLQLVFGALSLAVLDRCRKRQQGRGPEPRRTELG